MKFSSFSFAKVLAFTKVAYEYVLLRYLSGIKLGTEMNKGIDIHQGFIIQYLLVILSETLSSVF